MEVLKYLKNPKLLFIPLSARGVFRWISDEKFLKISYFVRGMQKLDLDNPERINDKLQWLKIHDHNPIYTILVDKYEVKKYVSDKIGNEYVFQLYGLYNSVDEIDFSILPDQFVLKCTHGSKCNIICKNKSELKKKETRRLLNKWLHMNWYDYGREWPYKNVQPRIIAEKYMEDESGELRDYKVMCFEGKPFFIQMHMGRFGKHHVQDIYNTKWEKMDINQIGEETSDYVLEKPVFLDEMLELSEALSKGIHHVRVDWYYVNGKLYFGEMTFFDGSGFCDYIPDEWNYKLGELICIESCEKQ